MNFNLEPWRKLYTRESLAHRTWPLFARALRDHLIRHAADDGTLLPRTDNPAGDMAIALGAHPNERDDVAAAIGVMLVDGYLSLDAKRLHITKFEEGQARSSSAERVRKHRARKRSESCEPVTLHVTLPKREPVTDETLPVIVTKREPVTDPIRSDPKRSETKQQRRADARVAPSVPTAAAAAAAGDPKLIQVRDAVAAHRVFREAITDPGHWVREHVAPIAMATGRLESNLGAVLEAVASAAATSDTSERPPLIRARLRGKISDALKKRPGVDSAAVSGVRPTLTPEERLERVHRAKAAEQREQAERRQSMATAPAEARALLAAIGGPPTGSTDADPEARRDAERMRAAGE